MIMGDMRLGHRHRLPDALRVLMEEFPREAWAADPGFTHMISFWLERHIMFRQFLQAIQRDTGHVLGREIDGGAFARRLQRLRAVLMNDLKMHHHMEDAFYFPRLRQLDRRITVGFDILDKDHQAIDAELGAFGELGNLAIAALGQSERADKEVANLLEGLGRLERFLDRHLTDEEELVVPVLLKNAHLNIL